MADLPKIASLWIGGDLSWLEQLCLKSFADAGHQITLYSYAPISNLPEGVLAGDANEIYPGEPMLAPRDHRQPRDPRRSLAAEHAAKDGSNLGGL